MYICCDKFTMTQLPFQPFFMLQDILHTMYYTVQDILNFTANEAKKRIMKCEASHSTTR